jgi:hypothetical protein
MFHTLVSFTDVDDSISEDCHSHNARPMDNLKEIDIGRFARLPYPLNKSCSDEREQG